MWAGIGVIIGAIISAITNKQQAVHQEDFQRDMANTAHQREVSDLRAAGLNPMLSGTGGGGASTPIGTSPQGLGDIISPAISTAMQMKKVNAELDNLRATNDNIFTDTKLKHELSKKAEADKEFSINSAKMLSLQIPKAENMSRVERTPLGEFLAPVDRVLQSIGLGSKSIPNLRQ